MCLSSHDDYFNFIFFSYSSYRFYAFNLIWTPYITHWMHVSFCSFSNLFVNLFILLSINYQTCITFYFLETLSKYNESIVKALSILRKPILLLPPMRPPRCQQLPRQKSLHWKIVQHHLLNPRRIIATKVPTLFRWRLWCQCSYKSPPR